MHGLRDSPFQVCRWLPAKMVGTRLGTTGGHHEAQSESQENRNIPTHASQIQNLRISYKGPMAYIRMAG